LITDLPHAREFLEFCRSKGARMFVLSTIHKEYFVIHTRNNGFDAFFERAYLAVRDKRAKIGQVLFENKLDPRETLFIGDMQHDIDTARHGGVHSCGVLTGYNRREQLESSKPDRIVDNLAELRAILERGGMEWGAAPNGSAELPRRPLCAVGALIYNAAGHALMVQSVKWSNLWGIPGGKIDFGETSVEALRREIKEETALDVADIQFVMTQDCVRSPEFHCEAHFVLLNYTCRVQGSEEVRLNDEAHSWKWVSISEAKKMNLNTPTRNLLERAHPH
jgi:ADP-ribose pyrophosphatase YjhB (NUDIX family)